MANSFFNLEIRYISYDESWVSVLYIYNIPANKLFYTAVSVIYVHVCILATHYIYLSIYRNIILPVVLYGCETWSLTLREERKLRVFENMVLRRIFEPRRDEVTGDWRWLHNEELNDLYSSPNNVRVIKSRRMRWAEHVARMGEERGV